MTTGITNPEVRPLAHERIFLHRADPDGGRPARAQVTYPGNGLHGGLTISAHSVEQAFALAAAKLTGMAVPAIPLWDQTLRRLLDAHQNLQQSAGELLSAERSLLDELCGQIVGLFYPTNGNGGSREVLRAVHGVATAATGVIHSLAAARQIVEAIKASDEQGIYAAAPVSRLMDDQQIRAAISVMSAMTKHGLDTWEAYAGGGTLDFRFPADMLHAPTGWAERMTVRWQHQRRERLNQLTTVLAHGIKLEWSKDDRQVRYAPHYA